MKNYLEVLYWGLPLVYLCLAISKVSFGWDGNDLVWRGGVGIAAVAAVLMSKRILEARPSGAKKMYGKACVALLALPLTMHLLGLAIIHNIPGLGAE